MSILTLVGCTFGDWEGAYVGGVLIDEGIRVNLTEVINGSRAIAEVAKLEVISEWLEGSGGTFPPFIDHIPYEAYTK